MLKILVVDDNLEKSRLLKNAILEVDFLSEDNIYFASDVLTAKKEIKKTTFDLIILDINLPPIPASKVISGAGLDVLSYIKKNAQAKKPRFLCGLTEFEDAEKLAEEEFSSPLWRLIKFSYSHDNWKLPIHKVLDYLIELQKPPYINDGHNYQTDIAIFTAIQEELDALLEIDASWEQIKVLNDDSIYYKGTFKNDKGSGLSVVATVAPLMGMPAAAITAMKLIYTFVPKYLVTVGICAGVREKTNIGDILVADPCFDWGSGKWKIDNETQQRKFHPAPYPWRLDGSIRSSIQSTSNTPMLLQNIHNAYIHNKPTNIPKVIIDAMASGGSVLQSSEIMNEIRDQHKNLIGIEMESYAVLATGSYGINPKPTCISFKSVCDFGDDSKCDSYHRYAAYTSARFFFMFAVNTLIQEDVF